MESKRLECQAILNSKCKEVLQFTENKLDDSKTTITILIQIFGYPT